MIYSELSLKIFVIITRKSQFPTILIDTGFVLRPVLLPPVPVHASEQ